MSALTRALLADLDDQDLRELAERLAPYLPVPAAPEPDRWLTTREAAAYVGRSVNALHKLTAERTIPFEQDAPGGRCLPPLRSGRVAPQPRLLVLASIRCMKKALTHSKPLPVRITPEQVARVDALRDLAPREAYVRRLLDNALAIEERKAAKARKR